MAKLYFRYGAMGSSKTANALMVAYNYKERGKRVLLAKPKLDTREMGVLHSRIGLEQPCIYVEELVEMPLEKLASYDCVIVDEAQFCKRRCGILYIPRRQAGYSRYLLWSQDGFPDEPL